MKEIKKTVLPKLNRLLLFLSSIDKLIKLFLRSLYS